MGRDTAKLFPRTVCGVVECPEAYDDGASPFNYFSPLIENLHSDPRHSAELQRMQLRAWATTDADRRKAESRNPASR